MKILTKTYETVDVLALMKEKNMSLQELFRLTGIDYGYLWKIVHEKILANEGDWRLIKVAIETGKEAY